MASEIELACASLQCWEVAGAVISGVPLCDQHQRLLRADLTLPRSRYTTKNGKPWFVYYVTWPHKPGIVKIGATCNPVTRFYGLRMDGQFPKILAVEPGVGDLETERHTQFADLRLSYRGEYFRFMPPLTDHVEAVLREHPDPLAMLGKLPWWLNPEIKASRFKDLPRCGAPGAETGQPCLMTAGHGTDHLGSGHCRRHEKVAA